jgi:hypothetical protein
VRNTESELELTVLLTVVSGEEAVREHLTVLTKQIDFEKAEIIVPFDKWSSNVGSLVSEFPAVHFHFIEDLGFASDDLISAHQHRLYDRRRAVGLRLSKGRIVAMTEDHARPADDWVRQIIAAHEQPYDVIGGAVENGVDQSLNRAWYYCDFGRYGRPFKPGEVSYLSDVNLAYKREALIAIRDVWAEAYHETTVHRALQKQGKRLFLDIRPVVYQNRPQLTMRQVLSERIAWGRVFAEERCKEILSLNRFLFAAGSLLLPLLLFVRSFQHMRRQKQPARAMFSTLPIVFLLLIGWSVGELLGYLTGEPKRPHTGLKAVRPSDTCF